MKAAPWLLVLAGLAGCGINERPTYVEPEPLPIEVPAPAPERFLRIPPNYIYRDPASGWEYVMRPYSDADGDFGHIDVLEPGRPPREATPGEAAFAQDQYRREVLEVGPEGELQGARRRVDAERRRRETLIDEQLVHTGRVIAEQETVIADLKASLTALPGPGAKGIDAQRQALQASIHRAQLLLHTAQARQALLLAGKQARDGAATAGDDFDDLLGGK